MVKTLAKIIIGLLSLWAIAFIIAEIVGVTIYFPFTIVEKQEIPYHRITSVRLAVFLTFAYFGFRYLFLQSEKLYPIQFLEIYIKSFTICCLFVLVRFRFLVSFEYRRRYQDIYNIHQLNFIIYIYINTPFCLW